MIDDKCYEMMKDFEQVLKVVTGSDTLYNHYKCMSNESSYLDNALIIANNLYGKHFIYGSDYCAKLNSDDEKGSLEPKEWFINTMALRIFITKWDYRYKDFTI